MCAPSQLAMRLTENHFHESFHFTDRPRFAARLKRKLADFELQALFPSRRRSVSPMLATCGLQ
jgi:hypothetical protein